MADLRRGLIAELARRLGVSWTTVDRWTKSADFPIDLSTGEVAAVEVDAILRWRRAKTSRNARRLAHRGNPSPRGRRPKSGASLGTNPADDRPTGMTVAERDLIAANLRIKQAHADRAELELAQQRGLLVDRADIEQRYSRNLVQVRRALLEIGRAIAPLAEGQSAHRIRELYEVALREALLFWTADHTTTTTTTPVRRQRRPSTTRTREENEREYDHPQDH